MADIQAVIGTIYGQIILIVAGIGLAILVVISFLNALDQMFGG